jgi:hypothetical protein
MLYGKSRTRSSRQNMMPIQSSLGLKEHIFAIFVGKHHFYAWSMVTAQHPDKLKYHPQVEYVILKGDQASNVELEQAMHGVNK